MTNILLVEDDQALTAGMVYALQCEGFSVETAATLTAARAIVHHPQQPLDLVLLDVMLPDGTGYDLCTEIRQNPANPEQSGLPVIFLSACDHEANIVLGLDGGGDDYLTKPFRIRELISRINAVIRRHQAAVLLPADERPAPNTDEILYGPLRMDRQKFKVWRGSQEISLTSLEFRLLWILLGHPGRVLSRQRLLALLWDDRDLFVDDNTLSVHIRHLREKVELDPARPVIIRTIRGVGYQIAEPDPTI